MSAMVGEVWGIVLAVLMGPQAVMPLLVFCGTAESSGRSSSYLDAGVNAAMVLQLLLLPLVVVLPE